MIEQKDIFGQNLDETLPYESKLLNRLTTALESGLYGSSLDGTRNPLWRLEVRLVAERIGGEEKTKEIISILTGVEFPKQSSLTDVLGQLPIIAARLDSKKPDLQLVK